MRQDFDINDQINLFQSLDQPLIVINPQGNITQLNPSAIELLSQKDQPISHMDQLNLEICHGIKCQPLTIQHLTLRDRQGTNRLGEIYRI